MRHRMLSTMSAIVLMNCAVSSFAETIAFRENTTLYVIPDIYTDPTPIPVEGIHVTGSYQVSHQLVAFKNGGRLFALSPTTNWRPIFIASGVTSYQLAAANLTALGLLYWRGNDLYWVADHTQPAESTILLSRRVRDAHLFNPE